MPSRLISVGSGPIGLIDHVAVFPTFGSWYDPAFEAKWGPSGSSFPVGVPFTSALSLFASTYLPFMGSDARAFWSGHPTQSFQEYPWTGEKPVPRVFDYFRDIENYGSPVTNLTRRELSSSTYQREHAVKHLSAVGRLLPTHDSLYTAVPQVGLDPYGLFPYSLLRFNESLSYVSRVVGSEFVTSVPTVFDVVSMASPLGESFQAIIDRMGDSNKPLQSYDSPVPYVGWLRDVPLEDLSIRGGSIPDGWFFGDHVWSVGPLSIDFSNFVWKPGYAGRYLRCKVSFEFEEINYLPGTYPLGFPRYKGIERVEGTTWLLGQNDPSAVGATGPDGIREWYTADTMPFVKTTESTCDVVPLSDTYGHNRQAQSHLYAGIKLGRDRHQAVAAEAADIRPSVMPAFADAMSVLRVTQTNYLETLAEAGELFELVPSLVAIMKAFLGRKPKSVVDAALRLGDLLSSGNLLVKFGLNPTAANVDDVLHVAQVVGPALKTLQSPQEVKGKYVGDFAHTLGPMTIVTRTSVRVSGLSDDFVTKAMGLDALGLAPLASNLWDVVPWSWFIDYFTNLAARLSVIDGFILGSVRGVEYCVHSYTLYDQANDDLAFAGFEPGHVEYKHYFREVSRLVPALFGGRYDFLAPDTPDAGIIASVLWQLLRSR